MSQINRLGLGIRTPGTSVRDIEVISALLGRELCTIFAGDEIAKHRLLPLKLPRLIIGVDPVGDLHSIFSLCLQ